MFTAIFLDSVIRVWVLSYRLGTEDLLPPYQEQQSEFSSGETSGDSPGPDQKLSNPREADDDEKYSSRAESGR